MKISKIICSICTVGSVLGVTAYGAYEQNQNIGHGRRMGPAYSSPPQSNSEAELETSRNSFSGQSAPNGTSAGTAGGAGGWLYGSDSMSPAVANGSTWAPNGSVSPPSSGTVTYPPPNPVYAPNGRQSVPNGVPSGSTGGSGGWFVGNGSTPQYTSSATRLPDGSVYLSSPSSATYAPPNGRQSVPYGPSSGSMGLGGAYPAPQTAQSPMGFNFPPPVDATFVPPNRGQYGANGDTSSNDPRMIAPTFEGSYYIPQQYYASPNARPNNMQTFVGADGRVYSQNPSTGFYAPNSGQAFVGSDGRTYVQDPATGNFVVSPYGGHYPPTSGNPNGNVDRNTIIGPDGRLYVLAPQQRVVQPPQTGYGYPAGPVYGQPRAYVQDYGQN